MSFCKRLKAKVADDKDLSKVPMSTLMRTLDMTAPITNEFMEMLDTCEEVSISDFVAN